MGRVKTPLHYSFITITPGNPQMETKTSEASVWCSVCRRARRPAVSGTCALSAAQLGAAVQAGCVGLQWVQRKPLGPVSHCLPRKSKIPDPSPDSDIRWRCDVGQVTSPSLSLHSLICRAVIKIPLPQSCCSATKGLLGVGEQSGSAVHS